MQTSNLISYNFISKWCQKLPNTNFELDFGEEDELDILFEPEFDLDAPEDKDDS